MLAPFERVLERGAADVGARSKRRARFDDGVPRLDAIERARGADDAAKQRRGGAVSALHGVSFNRFVRSITSLAFHLARAHSSSESLPNAGPALAYISAVNVVGRPRLARRPPSMMFDASTSSPDRSSTHSLSTESASLSSSSSSSSRAGFLPSRASLVVGFVAVWDLKSVSRSVVRASRRRARRTFFAGGASAASTSLTRFAGTATSSSSLSLASALPLIASTIETRRSDDAVTPERRAIATTRAMTTGDVWTDMAVIFTAILATMLASYATLTPVKTTRRRTTTTAATSGARWFACAKTRASKAEGEMFCLKYSACWIASVGVVIATRAYESFGRWGYLAYCGACAAPAIVAPLMRPSASDRGKALSERYIVKANVWIAVFSFIGNYWYTHYFYAVLKAEYTFDAHRLNDVPISMYLMTHAYFMFYHVLSNAALRRIRTGYVNDAWRFGFECAAVGAMAYSTAFMESLTICGFPYYSFADRHMAYTLGSAFYGIYFLVSFPMFLRVDETKAMPMSQVFWEAMGSGMAVLCLLDFVRVYLRIPFTMRIRG